MQAVPINPVEAAWCFFIAFNLIVFEIKTSHNYGLNNDLLMLLSLTKTSRIDRNADQFPAWRKLAGWQMEQTPELAAFLERYRSNLSANTVERQPVIDAQDSKLARQDRPIAAIHERNVAMPVCALERSGDTSCCAKVSRTELGGGRSNTDEVSREALGRQLENARLNTGQSRRFASFIPTLWNADNLGGFDAADLFAVNSAIARDMLTAFSYLANQREAEYPIRYQSETEELIRLRWPKVRAKANKFT